MASKRNQFDPGNSSGGINRNRAPNTNKDPSNKENRKTSGVHRTGSQRNAGRAPKPFN